MSSTEMLSLAPVTVEEGVPDERLESAAMARELAARLIDNDRMRAWQRSLVDGMLDGNAPYSNAALRALGQGYRANLNFREGEGALESAKSPYYDLLSEVRTYIEINRISGIDVFQMERFSRIIAKHFTTMLKSWDGFDFNMQLSQRQMLAHGTGPCVWEDEKHWQFRALKSGMVFIPDTEDANVGTLDVMVIYQEMSVSKLWAKVRNKKAATSAGWNTDVVLSALAAAAPKRDEEPDALAAENFQRALRTADLLEGVRNSTVPLFNVYVREFDGSITHGIVTKDGGEDSWLYRKTNAYSSFARVIVPFFYNVGSGEWHSVVGLGKKIYPHVEVSTRLNCQLVDNAFLGSSILLQQMHEEDTERTQLMQLGPLSIIPPGYSVQQGGIFADLNGPLAVKNMLSQSLANNVGSYRMRATPPAEKQGNPRTAREIDAEESQSSYLGKGAIARYYQGLDSLYREMFRRALKQPDELSKRFFERCVKDGVPEAVLKGFEDFDDVFATRTVGQGSEFQRKQAYRELFGIQGSLDERGRANIKEDFVASLVGQTKLDRYVTPMNEADQVTEHEAFAAVENAAIKVGAPVIVTSTQRHSRHAQIHLKAGADAVNSFQQGASLEEVVPFSEAIGLHVAEHLKFLELDKTREQEYALLMQQFTVFGNIVDELKNQLVQKQEAQQREQAVAGAETVAENVDPALVAKAKELELKLRMAQEEHAQKMRFAEEEHQMKLRSTVAASVANGG